jgi:hypothetical protein
MFNIPVVIQQDAETLGPFPFHSRHTERLAFLVFGALQTAIANLHRATGKNASPRRLIRG